MENNNSKRDERNQFKVFNDAIEYFDRSNDSNELNFDEIQSLDGTSPLLQELMLSELDNLKGIIGNDPDLKIQAMNEEEKEIFRQFIKYYSYCPICKQKNHIINLKKLYFNEDKQLIESLANLVGKRNKRLKKYNVQFGIPCCNCFKKYFDEE